MKRKDIEKQIEELFRKIARSRNVESWNWIIHYKNGDFTGANGGNDEK